MSVNTKTVRLVIGGMSCTACRNKITARLRAGPPPPQSGPGYWLSLLGFTCCCGGLIC